MKYIKKILLTLLFFVFMSNVKANNISNISMDVYLDDIGNAHIKEIWQANLTTGTEGYKSFNKLDGMSITNFTVKDDLGNMYTYINNWNTNVSFNSKAYKNGINYTSDGLELCFGISKYGDRIYTLEYDVNNIVVNHNGTEAIYFNFINIDSSVGHATITIHTPYSLNKDNVKVWAFGYKGTREVSSDSITFVTKNELNKNEYMVGLIKFIDNPFNTTNKSTKNFDTIYKEAMKGAKKPLDLSFLKYTPILLIILAIVGLKTKSKTFKLDKTPKELNNLTFDAGNDISGEINNYREIPCDGDVFYAYWLSYYYGIAKLKELKSGILGSLLLKWYKEGIITITKTKEGILNLDEYAIGFTSKKPTIGLEMSFYSMLEEASGENSILESYEFSNWCKSNKERIIAWYSVILNQESKYLENKGLISTIGDEVEDIHGNKKKSYLRHVYSFHNTEAIYLAGLKKFLMDDTIIDEKRHVEVHLWDSYLIFAELFGIAEMVKSEFKKIYPDAVALINDVNLNYVNNFSSIASAYSSMPIYNNSHDSSSNSFDSGSSSSGGGSSSSGSSGGGFR